MKNLKNLFVLLFVVLFTACTGGKGEKIKIGITQIVEHESLDDVRRGVETALADNGYGKEKVEFIYKFCNSTDNCSGF